MKANVALMASLRASQRSLRLGFEPIRAHIWARFYHFRDAKTDCARQNEPVCRINRLQSSGSRRGTSAKCVPSLELERTIYQSSTEGGGMWGHSVLRNDEMSQSYFKRYRMEISLRHVPFRTSVPRGYQLLPWDSHLLDAHAFAKYQSFRGELDALVFPCLGEEAGCRRLMGEISAKPGFVPEATWLAVYQHPSGAIDYCGTVQGIRDEFGRGGIQNLGVVAEHRGQGLGSSLLHHALIGFRRGAVRRVHLEVTAKNSSAVRLYRNMGFRHVKTVYKSVEAAMT